MLIRFERHVESGQIAGVMGTVDDAFDCLKDLRYLILWYIPTQFLTKVLSSFSV